MLMLALPLALLADPTEEKIFGDWAVACDNIRRCEATALIPMEWVGDEEPSQMVLTRGAGDGGFTIDIWPAAGTKGPIVVMVDGKKVADGSIVDTVYQPYGAAGLGLARGLVNGRVLTIAGVSGKAQGRVSLSGLSATLRYIDDVQGRVGTVTALVARGDKPASAVPAERALPAVAALRPTARPVSPADKAMLRALTKRGDCEGMTPMEGVAPEFHALDATATLALIPCGSGAYNFNYVPFVIRGGKAAFAHFDVEPGWLGEGTPVLTNSEWDAKTGLLHHFEKARGLGDCGTNQSWAWDGKGFRLIEAARLGECRGSIHWPTVFRANPVWK